jgi:hypothetical protein
VLDVVAIRHRANLRTHSIRLPLDFRHGWHRITSIELLLLGDVIINFWSQLQQAMADIFGCNEDRESSVFMHHTLNTCTMIHSVTVTLLTKTNTASFAQPHPHTHTHTHTHTHCTPTPTHTHTHTHTHHQTTQHVYTVTRGGQGCWGRLIPSGHSQGPLQPKALNLRLSDA